MKNLRLFEEFFDDFDEDPFVTEFVEDAVNEFRVRQKYSRDKTLQRFKTSYDEGNNSVDFTYYDEYMENGELVSVELVGDVTYEPNSSVVSVEDVETMDDEEARQYYHWSLQFDYKVLVGEDDMDVSSYIEGLDFASEYEFDADYESTDEDHMWEDLYGVFSSLTRVLDTVVYWDNVTEWAEKERSRLVEKKL